jgi:hypothetical protein
MADCHMHRSDRREPPGMALRRLLAPSAAPRLHTPRSRLPGRHRRRSTASAASHAASAAASDGRPRGPNGRARGRHRPPRRPSRRLRRRPCCGHRACCFCRPSSSPRSRIGRWSRLTRPAHRAHGKGRNDAPTAEVRVRTVEMDAGGWPGLGWRWWLRQGPGRRRVGAQEQQKPRSRGRAGRELASVPRPRRTPEKTSAMPLLLPSAPDPALPPAHTLPPASSLLPPP